MPPTTKSDGISKFGTVEGSSLPPSRWCLAPRGMAEKFDVMLCSWQIKRAASVVTEGSLLIRTNRPAQELSRQIKGEAPCNSASLGIRYKSPVSRST
jgi:hypothetical protein